MATRISIVLAVALLVVAAGLTVVLYEVYLAPGHATDSQNWAGYVDQTSVGNATGEVTLPGASDWRGSGVAGLWVGMGGFADFDSGQWPFWQAGVSVSCTSGVCSAELFAEGGTSGAPCNGTCSPEWTQPIGSGAGDSIWITVSGGGSGAVATITVNQDGFNTTYTPPAWTVLAGATSFPSAEWIFESPTAAGGSTDVMPTLNPPGATYSELHDSASLAAVGPILMEGNPNGQSVTISTLSADEFTAQSYDQ